MPVPPEMIVAQVDAVASDIGVDAVKVGMLADEATIDAVLDALDLLDDVPVVVDPVMVAESGATLLDPNAKAALIERVLPRATVVTPNLLEARRSRAWARAPGSRSSGGGCWRSDRARWSSPAATPRTAPTCWSRGRGDRIEGPRYPGRRLARLRLHPLLGPGGVPRREARSSSTRRALGA